MLRVIIKEPAESMWRKCDEHIGIKVETVARDCHIARAD